MNIFRWSLCNRTNEVLVYVYFRRLSPIKICPGNLVRTNEVLLYYKYIYAGDLNAGDLNDLNAIM